MLGALCLPPSCAHAVCLALSGTVKVAVTVPKWNRQFSCSHMIEGGAHVAFAGAARLLWSPGVKQAVAWLLVTSPSHVHVTSRHSVLAHGHAGHFTIA